MTSQSPGYSDPHELKDVLEILRGSRLLSSLHPPTIPSPGLQAVFFQEWTRPHHCFVTDFSVKRSIYPCLLVRKSDRLWEVEPFLLHWSERKRFLSISANAKWLEILLRLTANELEPLLPDPSTEYSSDLLDANNGFLIADYPPAEAAMICINAFLGGGYKKFLSTPGVCRKWFIAARWPTWVAKAAEGFSQDEAAAEVAKEEGISIYPSDTLRKMFTEMGLHWPRKTAPIKRESSK